MNLRKDFVRLIDHAPKVTCPGCVVEMVLRTLVPAAKKASRYTGTYCCPKCGTDTQREFSVGT